MQHDKTIQNPKPAFPLLAHFPGASRLVLGCMGWGGGWNAEPVEEAHIAAAHAALEAALENGISQLDHADIYTRGKAEQCMGVLFKRQPSLRQRLILQSKCCIRQADDAGPHRYDLSAAHIESSVEAIPAAGYLRPPARRSTNVLHCLPPWPRSKTNPSRPCCWPG